MRKTTKGALAAATGATLLLGGAGTMAYWTDSATVGGGAINAGNLSIMTDATNPGCGAWALDTAGGLATYVVGDPLVPGDVLTRSCRYTVKASGNHLSATLGLSSPSFSGVGGSFGGKLSATVSSKVNGVPTSTLTSANDGQQLTAVVTVVWDGSDTTHMLASTVLDNLTVTATQTHV